MTDKETTARSVGTAPDMGAWESGVVKVVSACEEKIKDLPVLRNFALEQNYPNPFNPRTNIQFSIPKTGYVTLKIYNILGQEMATLVSEKLISGNYTYTWDASDFVCGVYCCQLTTDTYRKVRKMILLK